MPIKKILCDLLESVPGALGAILADWEGETVDHASRMDDFELKVLGAHHGIILENLRQVASRLGKGGVQEVMIHTENMSIVVKPLTSDYFVVLTLERDALFARARHAMKVCSDRLKAEIE